MIQQTCKYVSSSLCPCFNTSSVTFYSILHQRKVLRMRSFYILLAIGVTFLLAIETRGQFKLSDMENHPHSQYRLRESEETRRKFMFQCHTSKAFRNACKEHLILTRSHLFTRLSIPKRHSYSLLRIDRK